MADLKHYHSFLMGPPEWFTPDPNAGLELAVCHLSFSKQNMNMADHHFSLYKNLLTTETGTRTTNNQLLKQTTICCVNHMLQF